MRRNTLGPLEYISSTLHWVVLLAFAYGAFLFCRIGNLRLMVSLAIFIAGALLGAALGWLFTFRNQRNYISLLCNLSLAFGPYFLVSYWDSGKDVLMFAGQLTASLLTCYFLLMTISYVHRRATGDTHVTTGRFLAHCLRLATRVALLALGLVMVIAMFASTFGVPFLPPARSADTQTKQEAIAENLDTFLLLEESKWAELTTEQRMDVLTVMGRIEAASLHIPEVDLEVRDLDDSSQGYYSHFGCIITLSLAHLSDCTARDAVDTLCHEYRHAYQRRLVALYNTLDPASQALPLFDNVAQYQYEFEHYVDSGDDGSRYDEYRAQLCEQDSYRYAKIATDDYFDILDTYISAQKP